ncbi:MAG: ribonuclease HII [Bacteroidota bacterium]
MLRPFFTAQLLEAGCDEVGRGCLAGPVVAAAVILPKDFFHPSLNDSKQLTSAQRQHLSTIVQEAAIAWAVGEASPQEIDQHNILNASYLAMHRAIAQLQPEPVFLLIDGNRFKPYKAVPHECIVKGDAQFAAIAAASILAKTYRDTLMHDLAQAHPGYGWETNVGYPTPLHRKALQQRGVTPHHRQSFRLMP